MNIEKNPRVLDMALSYIIDHCIRRKKCRDKTVNNLAFYLLSEREKPQELLDFLMAEEAKKQNGQAIYFELDYALNVCKQKEKNLEEKLKVAYQDEDGLRDLIQKMR